MNSKAQVFSLDLLIAAGLVFLAMALVINSIESISFSNKSDFDLMELQYVALTASDRFVSIAMPCEENGVKVLNCVATKNCLKTITKEKLGIPEGYSYLVEGEDKDCFADASLGPENDKPLYSINRIYLNQDNEVKQITFKVWKT